MPPGRNPGAFCSSATHQPGLIAAAEPGFGQSPGEPEPAT